MSPLNGFQVLFAILMAVLGTASLVAVGRRAVTRREGALWAALCIAACVAVLWPRLTSLVAGWLGIGRGADLISYLTVAVMLVGFWLTYMRLRALRRELTLLVRRLALDEGLGEERREPGPPREDPSDRSPR